MPGMTVPTPKIIYVWPECKQDFDKIAIEESVFEWREDVALTAIKNDGKRWESRVYAKSLGDDVRVVFQWFDERQISD